MKAPMVIKIGNIMEESSNEYGSGVRGPLLNLVFTEVSSSSSIAGGYSSGSCGIGGSFGMSGNKLIYVGKIFGKYFFHAFKAKSTNRHF